MLKILIADDHPIIREGLRRIVEKIPGMSVTSEAADGQEVLDKAARLRPDVILLDLAMPGRNGLDTIEQLKEKYPKLPVLVLSQHPEDQYAIRALKAGAAGYLNKESASEQLVEAIQKVASGGKYITASLAEQLAVQVESPSAGLPHEALSNREYEVLCLLGKGESVSKISSDLSLSVKTISTYRARIMAKMNLTRNAELIQYAMHHQLLSPGAAPLPVSKTPPRRSASPKKSKS